MNTLFSEV